VDRGNGLDGLRNERGRRSNGNSPDSPPISLQWVIALALGVGWGWELIDVGSKFLNKRLCSGASHNYAFSYFHASTAFRHDIIIVFVL
jgi:hypothetical protein